MSGESNQEPVRGSASSPIKQGTVVGAGRYTLERPLGRGGMGVVWLARDATLNEFVALKFLPPEIPNDPVALDDMRRETAKSRKLSHPNIVRIHDFFEGEGEAFVSMEYVDGPNLAALRMEQPNRVFPWGFLAPIITQLCQALEYAHGERIIHRDLKPANMMLDHKGRLKLADFGIAAVVDEAAGRISVKHKTGGTLAYMSPQQMDGELPRVTDDIYALGSTLYELLAGKAPFYSGDIAYQVRNLPAPPIEERLSELGITNDVPPAVAAMIMACLSKDPDHRPQSARAVAEWIGLEVGTAYSQRAVSEGTEPAPAEKRKPTVLKFALAGVTLAAMGAGTWLVLDHLKSPLGIEQPANPSELATNSMAATLTPLPPPPLDFELANMIWIPRGTFVMGSPESDVDRAVNETPQTEVTISRGFWLGKYEVTQADYFSLMGANPAAFKGDLQQPVDSVGWDDAVKYCAKWTERERDAYRLPAGYIYRLPTEAEWEYAARAGTTNRFSFGDDASALGEYAWFAQNSDKTTHPVGQKKANPWGLYDMHGNVWEWCLDWKGTYAGVKMTDPTGPRTGSFRVSRGGAWFELPIGCRSANRFGYASGTKGSQFVGFRVALAPPLQP